MHTLSLTLCFIRTRDHLLLARKKRRFGKDKWNGYGGKIEPNETAEQSATRELKEEAGITATELSHRGDLTFIYKQDNLTMHVSVFLVTTYTGTPEETEEMEPHWFPTNNLPYEHMWPDDQYWLPLFLADKQFTGTFTFSAADGEILSHTLSEQ